MLSPDTVSEKVHLNRLRRILFPIPIMLIVPVRIYLMPKMFQERYLHELDALPTEEAAPLAHARALQEAAATGLGPPASGEGGEEDDDSEVLEREMSGLRIKRHLAPYALARRASTEMAAPSSPGPRRRPGALSQDSDKECAP